MSNYRKLKYILHIYWAPTVMYGILDVSLIYTHTHAHTGTYLGTVDYSLISEFTQSHPNNMSHISCYAPTHVPLLHCNM